MRRKHIVMGCHATNPILMQEISKHFTSLGAHWKAKQRSENWEIGWRFWVVER